MPVCPHGHASLSDDYCDDCGAPMPGAGQSAHGTVPASAASHSALTRCPSCDAPRFGRFCEACGHNFQGAARREEQGEEEIPQCASGTWTAVVVADRDYYDRHADLDDSGFVPFPAHFPPRRFELAGTWLVIGRRSRSQGVVPDIDLAEPQPDPAVSHVHAYLVAQPGGAWAVLDQGSTNGTTINGSPRRIESGVEVPLNDGDRIHLGAWTTIIVSLGG